MPFIAHHTLDLPPFKNSPKVLIVRAPYYKEISDNLLAGALNCLEKAGAAFEICDMPGALEIAPAISIAHKENPFDGYVALGCVIRGETTHYETVCNDSARGLQLLGLQGLAIGNGILTVENMIQAQERADPDKQNKGGGAAAAALHLIALRQKFQ